MIAALESPCELGTSSKIIRKFKEIKNKTSKKANDYSGCWENEFQNGQRTYLINCQGKDFEVTIVVDMEASKCLVVSNAKRGECFIEVYVKPIDADVQVTSKNQGNNGGWENPEIEENRGVVYHSITPRERLHPFLAYGTPCDGHDLLLPNIKHSYTKKKKKENSQNCLQEV